MSWEQLQRFCSAITVSVFFKYYYFSWRIVIALQCCFSFYCTAKWISYRKIIYIFPLFWISFPFRSPQTIEYSKVSQKEKNKFSVLTHIYAIWKNWYKRSFLQSGNRDTDVMNKCTDTKGKRRGSGMN